MRRTPKRFATIFMVLATLAGGWFFWWRPAADLRWVSAHTLPSAADGAALTARWYGTTAVLLQAGDEAIFIDPFFSRPQGLLRMLRDAPIAPDEPLIADWLARAGVKQLRAVLVSHSHFDHAMDAGVVARQTGAMLIGSRSTANIGLGAGLADEQTVIVNGASAAPIELGGFRVRFIASQHAGATGGAPTGDIVEPLRPPARYSDYRQGGTYSIVVGHGSNSVLLHGSAGHVAGALDGVRADTVFLGAALVDDASDYLRQIVDAVGAKQVVLTHWDDFTRPLDEPLRPMPVVVNLRSMGAALAQRKDLQAGTAALGKPLAIGPASALP